VSAEKCIFFQEISKKKGVDGELLLKRVFEKKSVKMWRLKSVCFERFKCRAVLNRAQKLQLA
jgi:hypothetical protein